MVGQRQRHKHLQAGNSIQTPAQGEAGGIEEVFLDVEETEFYTTAVRKGRFAGRQKLWKHTTFNAVFCYSANDFDAGKAVDDIRRAYEQRTGRADNLEDLADKIQVIEGYIRGSPQ
jgi:hypothetical protein